MQKINHVVSVGMLVKDNAPRVSARPAMRVVRIDGDAVTLRHTARASGWSDQTTISVARIFSDGKGRKYGWNVVDAAPEGAA